MHRLHVHLIKKSPLYRRWHGYPYRHRRNWLACICVSLVAISVFTEAWNGSIHESGRLPQSLAIPAASAAGSSPLEDQIRSGQVTTASLITASHPRVWLRGTWDWSPANNGSLAWRIMHGTPVSADNPADDHSKYEFIGLASIADTIYNSGTYSTYSLRPLWSVIAAKALQMNWNFPASLPGTSTPYSPDHSADEYFTDARDKLLWLVSQPASYEMPNHVMLRGAVAYDWLVNEHKSDGTPVLSEMDKGIIQQGLMTHADYLRSRAGGTGRLFEAAELSNYVYVMAGFALYEPSRANDVSYAAINNKAKAYLDDFDTFWVGSIIPALNKQGADGGWHGGAGNMDEEEFILLRWRECSLARVAYPLCPLYGYGSDA